MEDDSTVFLNIVVDKIDAINVKEFMLAWMKQECKDFRIVFIDKDLSEKQKTALDYARGFAKAIGLQDQICIVKSLDEIPSAKQTKHLKDTSILPVDKMEVLKMRSEASKKMAQSASEKREAMQETKLETKQIHKVEKQEKSQMQKSLALLTRSPQKANLLAKEEIKEEKKQEKRVETTIQKTSLVKGKELLPQVQKKLQEKTVAKTEVAKPVEKVFFKIIVPNYNNMAYIKKCLDSILEQTFQDFKIIVVDDMSTDGSDKFCEAYARKHSNKIIFQQLKKKGYAGAARNVGLDYPIDCEYILFVDSDDWLYNNMILMKMKQSIVKNKFPLLIRMPMFHYYGQNSKLNRFDRYILPDKKTIFLNGPGPGRFCISEKLKNLRFIENRAKRNDVIWVLHCLDTVKPTEILSLNYCCQTYNRASTTSCQNNIDVQLSQRCIEDGTTNHINDVKQQKFKTKTCNDLAKLEINIVSNIYKPKIIVEDLLKNSYVISINNDRLHFFYQIFQNFGIKWLPKHFFGCIDKKYNVIQRIKQSHINLVEFAKKNNMPYVCIFEDDAYPQKTINNQLEKYLCAIPKDALMVVLGWISGQHQQLIKPFSKITQFTISGAHSYILFKDGYDRWLQLMKENHQFAYPPDNYIFKDMQNAYIVNYPLFIQYNKINSVHNHMNFVFNGEHETPPPKFEKVKNQ